MLDILLPLAVTATGGAVVFIQQILEKFGKVIRLLTILEEQNARLESKSNETLRTLEALRQRDDNLSTRISDVERYLQVVTSDMTNPFVLRYDERNYPHYDNNHDEHSQPKP